MGYSPPVRKALILPKQISLNCDVYGLWKIRLNEFLRINNVKIILKADGIGRMVYLWKHLNRRKDIKILRVGLIKHSSCMLITVSKR